MRQLIGILGLLAVCAVAADDPDKPATIVIRQPDAAERMTAEIIPLGDLAFEEIAPILRDLSSDEGTVGYLASRNAVVIYDQQQVVDRMKDFLKKLDRSPVNIRVDVTFANRRLLEDRGLTVDVDSRRRRPGDARIIIDDGKIRTPDRVEIGIHDRRDEVTDDTTQWLTVRSGHPARLRVGTDIVDVHWLREYHVVPLNGRGRAVLFSTLAAQTELQELGSSLYIQPTYRADGYVDVEVFPAIRYVDPHGRPHAYRVANVSTRVTVAPGRWITIGGNDCAMNDYLRQLFGPAVWSARTHTDALGITLRAQVLEAAPSRP